MKKSTDYATGPQLELDALHFSAEAMAMANTAIDEQFGKGYAKRNPILLAQFMQTQAAFYNGILHATGLCEIAESLREISLN